MPVLVVLDTMWGSEGSAPGWFRINPGNHSGRMLYRLTGCEFGELWVTNCCPEQTAHPSKHGKPDPKWLLKNLKRAERLFPGAILIIAGRVAALTFRNLGREYSGPIVFMSHPAARNWSLAKIDYVKSKVKYCRGL